MAANTEENRLIAEAFDRLPLKAAIALAARNALRLQPMLQDVVESAERDKVVKLLEAVDICAWSAGFAVFLSPSSYSDIRLAALLDTARSIAQIDLNAVAPNNMAGKNAIGAAEIALTWLNEEQSIEGAVSSSQGNLKRSNSDSSAWQAIEASMEIMPQDLGAGVISALWYDWEYLTNNKSIDLEGMSKRPLWPEDSLPRDWEALMARWRALLKNYGLENLNIQYSEAFEGGFDWETPYRWLSDWGQKNNLPLAEPISPKNEQQKKKAAQPIPSAKIARRPNPEAVGPDTVLLSRGETTIRILAADKVWTLGFEALLLPAVTADSMGEFARAFFVDVGATIAENILQGMDQPEPITVDRPLPLQLSDFALAEGFPTVVFVATAGTPRNTIEGAAQAVVAVGRAAAQMEMATLALPLIGTGGAGLDPQQWLEAVLPALASAAPFSGVTDIALAVLDPALAEAAKRIAGDIEERQYGTPSDRPVFDNDQQTRDDSLKVGDQARTFAKLLATRNIHLPISLGLFGNWGVGKTYFMDLMKEAIKTLSEEQPINPINNDRSTYMRRIAQIEFNAWHYVDTNLWASLAIR